MAQEVRAVGLPPTEVYEGADASRRLAELGLRAEYFGDSLRHGHDKRRGCSPLHPKSFPGITMWAETTLAMRGNCMAAGLHWEPDSADNYETVVDRRNGVAIAVVGGDVNTGVRGFQHPLAARRRGPVTDRRVSDNFRQLALDLPGLPVEADPGQPLKNYFFLVNARGGHLFSELSLPVAVITRKRVSHWAERILLPPVGVEDPVTPVGYEDEESDVPVVEVRRR
jgi:hypothetical protein